MVVHGHPRPRPVGFVQHVRPLDARNPADRQADRRPSSFRDEAIVDLGGDRSAALARQVDQQFGAGDVERGVDPVDRHRCDVEPTGIERHHVDRRVDGGVDDHRGLDRFRAGGNFEAQVVRDDVDIGRAELGEQCVADAETRWSNRSGCRVVAVVVVVVVAAEVAVVGTDVVVVDVPVASVVTAGESAAAAGGLGWGTSEAGDDPAHAATTHPVERDGDSRPVPHQLSDVSRCR